jgi:hypothetical protein
MALLSMREGFQDQRVSYGQGQTEANSWSTMQTCLAPLNSPVVQLHYIKTGKEPQVKKLLPPKNSPHTFGVSRCRDRACLEVTSFYLAHILHLERFRWFCWRFPSFRTANFSSWNGRLPEHEYRSTALFWREEVSYFNTYTGYLVRPKIRR